ARSSRSNPDQTTVAVETDDQSAIPVDRDTRRAERAVAALQPFGDDFERRARFARMQDAPAGRIGHERSALAIEGDVVGEAGVRHLDRPFDIARPAVHDDQTMGSTADLAIDFDAEEVRRRNPELAALGVVAKGGAGEAPIRLLKGDRGRRTESDLCDVAGDDGADRQAA
ncbi:MAG: hypothetical protein AAGF90_10585, partial [Pseudomonadota bacterium]